MLSAGAIDGSLSLGSLASSIKKNAAAVKSNNGTKNGDFRPTVAGQPRTCSKYAGAPALSLRVLSCFQLLCCGIRLPQVFHSAHRPSLEGVRVISSQCTDQLSKQEQGNTGFLGHGSDVTALSVPSWTEWRDAIPVVVVTNSLTLACFFFEGTVHLNAKKRDENNAENL